MVKNSFYSLLIFIVFLSSPLGAQIIQSTSFDYEGIPPKLGLISNGISDIAISHGVIWLATGNGLSRSADGGETWESFTTRQGLGKGGVSALWVNGDIIWVATAFDTLVPGVSDDPLDAGGGLTYSIDGGDTWHHIKQPYVTPVQNVTYDLAVFDTTVWIATWGGGVRVFRHWQPPYDNVDPDSFVARVPDDKVFDPYGEHNHKGFSVLVAGQSLWIGTAGGLNRSDDGGKTWTNFNHTNQLQPISGNWVVAIANQIFKDHNIIWAATWKAEGEDEFYGVSKSEDNGNTWSTTLADEKVYNFAFDDSIVYACAENGLYKSIDLGETWYKFPGIKDNEKYIIAGASGEAVYSESYYAAGVDESGNLWVGSDDGLAKTNSNGYDWKLYRAFTPTGQNTTSRTYAYPNPFSPSRHNQFEGDGYVRIQYNTIYNTRVTIKVYDFAMDLVDTVVESEFRPGNQDFSDVWDGKNQYEDEVANGVYFYKVELEGDGTYWGKIMIVN